mgnify:FL=1
MMYLRVHLSASISLYLTVGCNVFLKATAVGHKIKMKIVEIMKWIILVSLFLVGGMVKAQHLPQWLEIGRAHV